MPDPSSAAGRFALTGRVVTMDLASRVLRRGTVYVEAPNIVAVHEHGRPPPPGFEGVEPIDTGGTLYPGLIELHNHLSFNALRLWAVPQRFANRGQWPRTAGYAQRVSRPMGILGRSRDPHLLPALIRFVEAKCLVAGVTTSQGITLSSNMGIRRYYRGVVRNVEVPDDPALPPASTRVQDLAANDWQHFDDALKKETCLLLHLSEGVDEEARSHFLALQNGSTWAITGALAAIHCAGLTAGDFQILGERGGAMVWSPLSNYLLYGGTARIQAARAAGVRLALGSDWSPTGSKNLLGELKVARLVNAELALGLSDQDLVAMVTRTPAEILRWDRHLGSIAPDKRADLLVVRGASGDPYGALLSAAETDVALVTIGGMPRFGAGALMRALGASGEALRIGGHERVVAWGGPEQDPDVGLVSLAEAREVLADALGRLPELEKHEKLERGTLERALSPAEAPRVQLALDELEPHGLELRPHLPFKGLPTMLPAPEAKGPPLPLEPLALDALTVADDDRFVPELEAQQNLPPFLKEGLARLLGG